VARLTETAQMTDTERLMAVVNTIALDAIELPPEERQAFIQKEAQETRQLIAKSKGASPLADEFCEKLEQWIAAAVRLMENSGGAIGRA